MMILRSLLPPLLRLCPLLRWSMASLCLCFACAFSQSSDATAVSVSPVSASVSESTPTGTLTDAYPLSETVDSTATEDTERAWLFEPVVLASGAQPEAVADQAVENWLARAKASPLANFDFTALLEAEDAQSSTEAMCEDIAVLGNNPVLISQLEVNLESRRLHREDTDYRVYSYASGMKDSRLLAQVYVYVESKDVEGEGTIWEAKAIQSQMGSSSSLPSFLSHPLAPWLFVALSLYVLYLLLRPSWYRRWLLQGWQLLREHRGVTLTTITLLYGMYILGHLAAMALPMCQQAMMVMVADTLQQSGISSTLQDAEVIPAATVIFSWNFIQGAVMTTFSPAMLFGIPAYLMNVPRFFLLGFALAPSAVMPMLEYSLHIPVAIIELMAYVLVTAGGGMLVVTIMREGIRAFNKGLQKLLLMLPIAFLLLLIGAWYEAVEIFAILPFLRGL